MQSAAHNDAVLRICRTVQELAQHGRAPFQLRWLVDSCLARALTLVAATTFDPNDASSAAADDLLSAAQDLGSGERDAALQQVGGASCS